MKTVHTFSICAFKESRYLEQCIRSLLPQRSYSNIIMCTSTPNEYIYSLAEKYSIPLYVRDGKSDIIEDWNFAIKSAGTKWVTIVHQDDVYSKRYAAELHRAIQRTPDAALLFTDYQPLKNQKVTKDLNSRLRRFFRIPMKSELLSRSRFFRRGILGFGNSICCPTCAYNTALLGTRVFRSELRFACDWDTFVDIAEMPYPFLYIPKVLVYYRIHDEATSMQWTETSRRKAEELVMFRRFWPDWIIRIGYPLFRASYRTYECQEDGK